MHTGNFPGKVLARQQRALARLKGPTNDDPAAMARYEQEKAALIKATSSVGGNPIRVRTKKDRTSRAKVR